MEVKQKTWANKTKTICMDRLKAKTTAAVVNSLCSSDLGLPVVKLLVLDILSFMSGFWSMATMVSCLLAAGHSNTASFSPLQRCMVMPT